MAAEDRPASLRAWAMAFLVAVYAAGAYHAWQAIAVPRHALPAADHLQQLAAALPAAGASAAAARGLCASPGPTLHLTLLPDSRAQQSAVDLAALADSSLQPALARLAGAASISSSVALLPPPLPRSELRWVEQHQAYVLPSAAAAAWAQQLQQAAWEAGGSAQQQTAGQVLLYVPPATQQPLLLEPAVGSAASSSLQLSDNTLLLAANQQQASSSSSGSGELEAEVVQRILSWLLQPLSTAGSLDGSSGATAANATIAGLQHSLAGACAADAAAVLQRAAAAATAAREQPVTAGMAAAAAEAAQLLHIVADAQHAGQTDPAPLAVALRAWAVAQQLLHDPGSGARPAFPPEHAMAVLLPLSLPVTLVLVQAVGRQASAWKQRRRQQQAGRQCKQAEPDGVPAGSRSE